VRRKSRVSDHCDDLAMRSIRAIVKWVLGWAIAVGATSLVLFLAVILPSWHPEISWLLLPPTLVALAVLAYRRFVRRP